MITKEFRDKQLSAQISKKIRAIASDQKIKICHVCGTHEWTITHYGLRGLLPKNVEVIAGPGCPVCVVPSSDIDAAIKLALDGIVVTTYGDIINVPGSKMSLQRAKALGGDVRAV